MAGLQPRAVYAPYVVGHDVGRALAAAQLQRHPELVLQNAERVGDAVEDGIPTCEKERRAGRQPVMRK